MSSELRLKKLRGSGGYVMARLTDEQQSKGNLGGPDLFLAPIGRLDPDSISGYHCNTCEKDFEGSPKIDYTNPNEQVAENLTLAERGQYICQCGTPLAEYRKFASPDESRGAGNAYNAEQMTRASVPAPEPPAREAPQPAPQPEPPAQQPSPAPQDVNTIAGMQVYDEEARKVGTARQVGIDASHTIVLVMSRDDGAETTVPWSSVKKVGQIIVLGGTAAAAAAAEPGKCPKCGFANKAGAKFCEECGNSL